MELSNIVVNVGNSNMRLEVKVFYDAYNPWSKVSRDAILRGNQRGSFPDDYNEARPFYPYSNTQQYFRWVEKLTICAGKVDGVPVAFFDYEHLKGEPFEVPRNFKATNDAHGPGKWLATPGADFRNNDRSWYAGKITIP